MRVGAVLVCALALLAAVAVTMAAARPVLDDNLIEEINRSGASWTAGRNKRFEGVELEDAMRLLGSLQRKSHLPKRVHTAPTSLPDSFDARKQWPSCIHPIRNQEQCGSCWAFGATEALSDRFCIQEKVNVVLSPQDLVSCDHSNMGCDGGYLDAAWQYMKSTGVVADSCMPYTSGGGSSGSCSSHCTGSGSYKKYHAKSVYDVSSSENNIMQEIMTNGPVEAAFDVYQDFFSYKGGVYTHKSGGLAGGHAIKIIGWGVLSGDKYWLVANSWGTSWGESGFFMIKRGVNECGIESNVVAGMAGSSGADMLEIMPAVSEDAPILDDEVISKVNSMPSGWVAEHNDRFDGMTIKEARRLLGAKRRASAERFPAVVMHAESIPDSFDSRQQWPNCIHPIRNQEQCGSCWAFAASESLSDRFCIASQGSVNVILSPQDLVSCDTTNDGCDGGFLDKAWEWMAQDGIATDSCMPYTSGSGASGSCPRSCQDGSTPKLYYAQESTIHTFTDEDSIATAIMTNGPVEAAFTVYQDFFSYKGGVYSHQYGSAVGGHAIKIIGWGSDNGQKYWLVANSWGTSWGENGFFKIARGVDECGIEDDVVAGLPKL